MFVPSEVIYLSDEDARDSPRAILKGENASPTKMLKTELAGKADYSSLDLEEFEELKRARKNAGGFGNKPENREPSEDNSFQDRKELIDKMFQVHFNKDSGQNQGRMPSPYTETHSPLRKDETRPNRADNATPNRQYDRQYTSPGTLSETSSPERSSPGETSHSPTDLKDLGHLRSYSDPRRYEEPYMLTRNPDQYVPVTQKLGPVKNAEVPEKDSYPKRERGQRYASPEDLDRQHRNPYQREEQPETDATDPKNSKSFMQQPQPMERPAEIQEKVTKNLKNQDFYKKPNVSPFEVALNNEADNSLNRFPFKITVHPVENVESGSSYGKNYQKFPDSNLLNIPSSQQLPYDSSVHSEGKPNVGNTLDMTPKKIAKPELSNKPSEQTILSSVVEVISRKPTTTNIIFPRSGKDQKNQPQNFEVAEFEEEDVPQPITEQFSMEKKATNKPNGVDSSKQDENIETGMLEHHPRDTFSGGGMQSLRHNFPSAKDEIIRAHFSDPKPPSEQRALPQKDAFQQEIMFSPTTKNKYIGPENSGFNSFQVHTKSNKLPTNVKDSASKLDPRRRKGSRSPNVRDLQKEPGVNLQEIMEPQIQPQRIMEESKIAPVNQQRSTGVNPNAFEKFRTYENEILRHIDDTKPTKPQQCSENQIVFNADIIQLAENPKDDRNSKTSSLKTVPKREGPLLSQSTVLEKNEPKRSLSVSQVIEFNIRNPDERLGPQDSSSQKQVSRQEIPSQRTPRRDINDQRDNISSSKSALKREQPAGSVASIKPDALKKSDASTPLTEFIQNSAILRPDFLVIPQVENRSLNASKEIPQRLKDADTLAAFMRKPEQANPENISLSPISRRSSLVKSEDDVSPFDGTEEGFCTTTQNFVLNKDKYFRSTNQDLIHKVLEGSAKKLSVQGRDAGSVKPPQDFEPEPTRKEYRKIFPDGYTNNTSFIEGPIARVDWPTSEKPSVRRNFETFEKKNPQEENQHPNQNFSNRKKPSGETMEEKSIYTPKKEGMSQPRDNGIKTPIDSVRGTQISPISRNERGTQNGLDDQDYPINDILKHSYVVEAVSRIGTQRNPTEPNEFVEAREKGQSSRMNQNQLPKDQAGVNRSLNQSMNQEMEPENDLSRDPRQGRDKSSRKDPNDPRTASKGNQNQGQPENRQNNFQAQPKIAELVWEMSARAQNAISIDSELALLYNRATAQRNSRSPLSQSRTTARNPGVQSHKKSGKATNSERRMPPNLNQHIMVEESPYFETPIIEQNAGWKPDPFENYLKKPTSTQASTPEAVNNQWRLLDALEEPSRGPKSMNNMRLDTNGMDQSIPSYKADFRFDNRDTDYKIPLSPLSQASDSRSLRNNQMSSSQIALHKLA